MFCREDIELIVNAMYKDELRNICEKINIMELRILEIIKLNSGFKRYLTKLFLIIEKVCYFFSNEKITDRTILSRILVSPYQKEREYKLELQRLKRKKNEIKNLYNHIISNILEDELLYVQNLILMRSIEFNH